MPQDSTEPTRATCCYVAFWLLIMHKAGQPSRWEWTARTAHTTAAGATGRSRFSLDTTDGPSWTRTESYARGCSAGTAALLSHLHSHRWMLILSSALGHGCTRRFSPVRCAHSLLGSASPRLLQHSERGALLSREERQPRSELSDSERESVQSTRVHHPHR